MKSKRSRKDNAWRKSLSKKKLSNEFINKMIAELFSMYDEAEAADEANEKFLDECPTIGMFKVRKSFNTHESVEL